MPRFRYVGPFDGIDIPLLRLVDVKPGDEFDVSDAQAELLGAQPDNYEPVDEETAAIAAVVQADAAAAFEALVPATPEPVPAIVGESGPEAVIPLSALPDTTTDAAPADDPAQEG